MRAHLEFYSFSIQTMHVLMSSLNSLILTYYRLLKNETGTKIHFKRMYFSTMLFCCSKQVTIEEMVLLCSQDSDNPFLAYVSGKDIVVANPLVILDILSEY